ncbi:MAG: phage integrase SAM-like domain-containing protein [Oscillospiraceae bacterium]|jgi:integrase/recombinase XerD|nr:phage integrase SAM-like domain-containing protein [Oscillospiraceae bacterium]
MPRKPAAARSITMQSDTPNITWGKLCAEVVRFKRLRNLAPDTISYYEDCGRYFADFFGEDALCQTITEDTYYNYIEYLHETKPDLKTTTERSYLTGIRAILYFSMKKDYIQQFRVQLPKMDEVIA